MRKQIVLRLTLYADHTSRLPLSRVVRLKLGVLRAEVLADRARWACRYASLSKDPASLIESMQRRIQVQSTPSDA